MGSVRVVLNKSQVGDFLRSAEMESLMGEYARRVASRAGDGFDSHTWRGSSRVIGTAGAATWQAWALQSREPVLQRALGAARQ